jgi:RNA polymerase sigma-70 factor (ECF subfamily)
MSQPPESKSAWIGDALSEYERPLLRYAARLVGDLDRARDVVQDTFLRLCRQDPARLNGHLAQWLFTVCRNRALDVRRKEARERPLGEDALDESRRSWAPTPVRALEEREAREAAAAALAMLPAAQQEVLRLKFQQGLSYQEISAVTGRTVSYVGVLLHNGIKSIRARLASGQPALRRVR